MNLTLRISGGVRDHSQYNPNEMILYSEIREIRLCSLLSGSATTPQSGLLSFLGNDPQVNEHRPYGRQHGSDMGGFLRIR